MDRLNFVKVNTFTLKDPVKNEKTKKKKKPTTKQKKKTDKTRRAGSKGCVACVQGACWGACVSSERSSQESKQPGLCLMDKGLSRQRTKGLWMAETHGEMLSVTSHEGNTN